MVANFAIENDTQIIHDMENVCNNDTVSVTFMIDELKVNAANITFTFSSNQYNANSTKYWSLSESSITFP